MIKASIISVVANIITVIISIISVPLLLSILGNENYAIIGLFLTLQGVLLVLEGGISIATIESVVNRKNEVVEFRNLRLWYFLISLMVFILGFSYAYIILNKWESSHALIYSLLIGSSLAIRLYLGYFKAQLFGLLLHSEVFLFAIPLYFMRFSLPVMFNFSVTSVLLNFCFSFILELVLYHFYLGFKKNYKGLHHWSFRNRKNDVTAVVTLASIFGTLLFQSDRIGVSLFYLSTEFGEFQAISTFTLGIFLVTGPIGSVFQSRLFSKANNEDSFKLLLHGYSLIIVGLTSAAFVVFMLFGEAILLYLMPTISKRLGEIITIHSFYALVLGTYGVLFMYGVIKKQLQSYILITVVSAVVIISLYSIGLPLVDSTKLVIFSVVAIFLVSHVRLLRILFHPLAIELLVLSLVLFLMYTFVSHVYGFKGYVIAISLSWLVVRMKVIFGLINIYRVLS